MTGTIRLVEQTALLRNIEQVTRTGQETLARMLRQMEALDFRPVMSADDYLMNTIRANIDNDRLTDAEFRDFIRNSLATDVLPIISADTDGIADNGPQPGDYDGDEMHQLPTTSNALYCKKCGGIANPLGYRQWACNSCKAPLGVTSVTTNNQPQGI
jgi:hypothetical protein